MSQKIVALLFLILSTTEASFSQQVINPQEAFPVEIAYQNNVLQVSHQIKEGYYLYRDKISYETRDKGSY